MGSPNRLDINVHEVNIVGGKPCLDFTNTIYWRDRENREELLRTYGDLVDWALRIQLIPMGQAEKLKEKAERNPDQAESARRRAIALRDLIYRIFSALSEGHPVDEDDLDRLSFEWNRRMSHSRLIQGDDGFCWKIDSEEASPNAILDPILASCIDLLTSRNVRRVKKCADQYCSWLFYDNSRNLSRRWCDMKDCGNRAKFNRFYKRAKTKKGARTDDRPIDPPRKM